MRDYIRGAKAGALSGFIFGLAVTIFSASFSYYFSLIILIFNLFSTSIFYVFLGFLFGLLFIRFYDRLHADDVTTKSIVLSVYSWVAIFLFFTILLSAIPSISIRQVYQTLVYILIAFVLYSITYALIFEKIKPSPTLKKNYLERCPNCGAGIQQDYTYCPYCEINLLKCPECKKIIKNDYNFCPYCKTKL